MNNSRRIYNYVTMVKNQYNVAKNDVALLILLTYSQVGLIAINILGEPYGQEYSGQGDAPYNPHYTSPYDDLAFEMYVDREVAKIIRQMEMKKLQAAEGMFDAKLYAVNSVITKITLIIN